MDSKPEEDLSQTLSYRIGDLENFYADNVLSEDLKEIYAHVQMNCNDFRSNVFLRNLDIIEENLCVLDRNDNNTRKKVSSQDYDELVLKNIKNTAQLLKEFSRK